MKMQSYEPLENREFDMDGRHIYFIMSYSHPFKAELPRKKVVRIDDAQAQLFICSDGALGLKDPKGNIPKAFWNWAGKFGIPMYFKTMLKACYSYPEWLKDKKKTFVVDDDNFAIAAAALKKMTDNNDEFEVTDIDNGIL
ncbi:unnamed protein product, partial [Didymodactylos carnosus]